MPNIIEMPPNVWGPFFWNTIHIITLAYPSDPDEQTKQAAKDFFYSLQYLLPCSICKEHYRNHLAKYPPEISTKKDIIQYAFNLHNLVNKDLGKREISYQEFINHIQSLSNKSTINTSNILYILLGSVAGISLCYYFYKK